MEKLESATFLHPVRVASKTKSYFSPKEADIFIDGDEIVIQCKMTGKIGRTTIYNAIWFMKEGDNSDARQANFATSSKEASKTEKAGKAGKRGNNSGVRSKPKTNEQIRQEQILRDL